MSKKYNFVYKTTNNLNGDYYYGVHSTNNLNDGYIGSGKRFLRAVNKYGKENFTREIVQYFSNIKNAYSLEAAIVTPDLLLDEHCLNIAVGGMGGAVYGRKLSEEAKQNISKHSVFKDNIKRQEVIDKISKTLKGRPLSGTHKQSISSALKGRQKTKEHLQHMSQSLRKSQKLKNTLSSKEYKEKMSNSLKGMIFINNGIINKRVKDTEKDIFLNNGWQLGRIKINK